MRNRAYDRDGLLHRFVNLAREIRGRWAAARVEFGLTYADVLRAAYAADHPLPDVSIEMQHQVANGVVVLRAAHPDLFRSQFAKASLHALAELREPLGGTRKKVIFDHIRHLTTLSSMGAR